MVRDVDIKRQKETELNAQLDQLLAEIDKINKEKLFVIEEK